MLASLPRSVFVMIRGSEDEADDTVVWCNPKNNNGALAPRSAWHRKANRFDPAPDFDWSDFDKPPDKRAIITLEHLAEVFAEGDLELKDAAHALASIADVTKGAAYNALSADGRFKTHLARNGELLTFHA